MTGNATTPLWTAREAAAATGGMAIGDWAARGVSIDTRTLVENDLFVAISGPNFDGQTFAEEALNKGAAAVVVHDGGSIELPERAPRLVVGETTIALRSLGRAARGRTDARIVAVTGSVGKTGTKEALRLALSAQGKVTATTGNLNNHWGLPLSLARMPADTAYGVFELGMSAPGELEPLSRMTRPHVAIITAIAEVHSAYFDSLDGISDAKAEIFSGLEPGGTAILNRDDAKYERLAAQAEDRGITNIISFGAHAAADYRLLDCELRYAGSDVIAECKGETIEYRVGIPGRHWVTNSLAVLAAVQALGADVAKAAAELVKMDALTGRGKQSVVSLGAGDFVVIDESYNASPVSMAAAIEVLGQGRMPEKGRRVAVLGDMLELGPKSEALHAELADVLIKQHVDVVFTAGQYMSALWDALPPQMRGGHACTAKKLSPMVSASVRAGDVVMVKGSLGSQTGQIVNALLETDAPAGPRRAANGE